MNSGNEHYEPTFAPPPPVDATPIEPGRSSKKGLYGLLGCGGCVVLGIAVVVLGSILLVWAGMGIFADQVKADLRENPVIVEHLGMIEDLEVEIMGSLAAPGDEEFVFRARGTKGRGEITAVCVTRDAETEEVVSGTLQMRDGEVYDLFPLPELPLEQPDV